MQKMKQFELFIWLEQLSALPQRERRRCNARDNTPSNTATQQHSNTRRPARAVVYWRAAPAGRVRFVRAQADTFAVRGGFLAFQRYADS